MKYGDAKIFILKVIIELYNKMRKYGNQGGGVLCAKQTL
jgi:hypothetical protein